VLLEHFFFFSPVSKKMNARAFSLTKLVFSCRNSAIQKVFNTYKAANKSNNLRNTYSGSMHDVSSLSSLYGSNYATAAAANASNNKPNHKDNVNVNALLENLRLPTFASPLSNKGSGAAVTNVTDSTYLCSGLPRGGTVPSLGCDSAWNSDTDVLSSDEAGVVDDVYASVNREFENDPFFLHPPHKQPTIKLLNLGPQKNSELPKYPQKIYSGLLFLEDLLSSKRVL
jgi:hypothetical protein